jgi:hypothetical protein
MPQLATRVTTIASRDRRRRSGSGRPAAAKREGVSRRRHSMVCATSHIGPIGKEDELRI